MAKAGTTPKPVLRIFLLGPGVGESIIIQLPCGSWGVVDCYQSASGKGTLDFLRKMAVPRLAFFCCTHPHHDHFHGAHELFKAYAGRIDRIWRDIGFSQRDLETQRQISRKLVAASRSRYRATGDSEAKNSADDYEKLLQAISTEKHKIPENNYRRIAGPAQLMTGAGYEINALRPSAHVVDEIETRLSALNVRAGFVAFSDDGGEFLNSLSVVLQIKFGEAHIFLLADAQGELSDLHDSVRKCTIVKAAHHGSANGLGAELLTSQPSTYQVQHVLMTPYNSSQLPRKAMVDRYRAACKKFYLTTESAAAVASSAYVLGTVGGQKVAAHSGWIGLKVTEAGVVTTQKGFL